MSFTIALRAIPLRLKLGGLIILALLAGWIAFNLASLTSYPTPQPDDAFFGIVATQFLNHGQFGNPIEANLSGSQDSLFHLGRIYIILIAAFFKLFGIGLYQGRLLVLIGHWLSVVGLFFVGKKLWGWVEGLMAALIMLTAWYAFWSAHTVRPDSWVHAAGIGCLLLVLQLREHPSPKLGFITGLAAIIILDVHLKALHYTVATLGMATLMTLPKSQTRNSFWAMSAGIMLGAMYWVALHILPDPQLALAQWQSGPNAKQLTPKTDLINLLLSTRNVVSAIFRFTQAGWIEAIYFGGGTLALALSRKSTDRWAVAWILMYWASFTFLMPDKSLIHIYLLLPVLALQAARGLSLIASALAGYFSSLHKTGRFLPVWLIAPLILLYIAGDLKLAWSNRVISYEGYSGQLKTLIPNKANILGETTWWWTFRDGRFVSDLNFTNSFDASGDDLFARALASRDTRYVLFDESFSFWQGDGTLESDLHQAFASYLQHRCQQLGNVDDYFYGVDTGTLSLKKTTVYDCAPPAH